MQYSAQLWRKCELRMNVLRLFFALIVKDEWIPCGFGHTVCLPLVREKRDGAVFAMLT